MEHQQSFSLVDYLTAHFPGFEIGGNTLDRWPLGLRFNIGLKHVERATTIFEQAFGGADRIVLIGEDWPWDFDPNRWYPLFSLPGLIRPQTVPMINSYLPYLAAEDDEQSTLTWAELSPSALAIQELFQAIANQDHGLSPSVTGRVHILDPDRNLLFHMYDDRGLDIIATSTAPLLRLRDQFTGWLNRAKLETANRPPDATAS